MDPTTLTEHGCTWTRAETPDRDAGYELDRLRAQCVGDTYWQAHCDLLAATYEDVLREQAPCAEWYPARRLITACVRHMGSVKPLTAWARAKARMAESTPEAQS